MKGRLWVSGIAVLLLVVNRATEASPPRFDPPVVSGGSVSLTLRGDPGQALRIQASSNWVDWAEVGSGAPADGVLRITNEPASASQWFFRGLEVPDEPPDPSVTPQAGALTAVSLVTPERGGLLQIFTPEGTEFTLNLPTNAVFRPTLARMTLLTNLIGLPAAGGLLGAVRLEPEGLVLASPTFLECTYPTNLPRSRVASFAFDHDGRRLNLAPDLVGTNRVRLLVSQFRSHGSALFTLPELESLLATGPVPQDSVRPRRGVRPQATLEECYPEEEAEAKALDAELTEAIRPLQQEIAGELAIERQRQLFGVEDEEPGSTAVVDVMAKASRWYEANIQPRVAGAMRKCLVGRALIPWMLGWERQRQLMGVGSEGSSVADVVGLLARCQEQVLECCETRGPDQRLVVALLGIERQLQLLGGGNVDGLPGFETCLPEWYGELRITDTFRTNYNRASVGGEIFRGSEVKNYELTATVVTATEEIVEPFPLLGIPGFTNIIFTLTGSALGAHTVADDRAQLPICPGGARSFRRVQPQDSVGGYRDQVQWSSSVSNVLQMELTVLLSDEDASLFAPKTTLSFELDTLEAPKKGMQTRQQASSFGSDCEVETEESLITGTDLYLGDFVTVGRDEFSAAPGEIRYNKTTPMPGGVTREIKVLLRRRN
ncbi:MAG: hypothetical protein J0M24_01020 [Verrucomicrobia bacterium]|nr:hypothetical protein [Verrucomicrobiota bacterium]